MFTAVLMSAMLLQQVPQPVTHPIFNKMVAAVNVQRDRYNQPRLTQDPHLMNLASMWAAHMARTGQFHHSNYGVAENIAAGQVDVTHVMESWMNSSGHRANILNGGYRHIGCACYMSKRGTIYWVQCFR